MTLLLILRLLFLGPNVVAFGDSITVGYYASAPEHAYTRQLEWMTGAVVDNRAVGGSGVADQTTQIIAYSGNADTVVWLTGVNDMLRGTDTAIFEGWLDQGLTDLDERGLRVYLGNCIRLAPNGYVYYGRSDEDVQRINAAIANVAAAHPKVTLVDTAAYDPLTESYGDGVHPNDAGHRVLASLFAARILPYHNFIPIFLLR